MPKQEGFGFSDLGFWPVISVVKCIGTLSLAKSQSFQLDEDLATVSCVYAVAKWDYYNTLYMWLVLKTTWKLQLEQYVAAHEIKSVSCEAHSTSTFQTLHFPPICIWLQWKWRRSVKSCVRQPQAACLCLTGSILEQPSCASWESETGEIGYSHCNPWEDNVLTYPAEPTTVDQVINTVEYTPVFLRLLLNNWFLSFLYGAIVIHVYSLTQTDGVVYSNAPAATVIVSLLYIQK